MIVSSRNGSLRARVTLVLDDCEHETAPSSGMYHDLSLRWGRGLGTYFLYGQAKATTCFFVRLLDKDLVQRRSLELTVPRLSISPMTSLSSLVGPYPTAIVRLVLDEMFSAIIRLIRVTAAVLGTRAMVDFIFREPPLYMLAGHGGFRLRRQQGGSVRDVPGDA
jgi:hypothetical protein